VVDLFSNGVGFGGFGLGLADVNHQYDYVGGGITLAVPEPSTWAMMALGFAGLGFAGYRKRSGVPVAA
jgi:PEP-CTERM motif